MRVKSSNPFFDDYVLVEYEFMTLCNKSCSYCYNVADGSDRFTNDLDTILTDMTEILTVDNPKIILNLIGGEIMTHKHFETIIEHVYNTKQPETKVLMYTHGDHRSDWFQRRLEPLKKFGDQFKLHCTVHFEDLNYERFKSNLEYMHENFPLITLYMLVDDVLIDNLDYIQSLLDSCERLKLFGLVYDGFRGIDLMKQLVKFKKLEHWAPRFDNQFTLDEGVFPQVEKLFDVYKGTKDFNFYGQQCALMIYEVDRFGNITKSCDDVIIGNIRDGKKDMFDFRTITCCNQRCMESLSNLDVT